MEEDLYDEFGNYIGASIDSDEESDEAPRGWEEGSPGGEQGDAMDIDEPDEEGLRCFTSSPFLFS